MLRHIVIVAAIVSAGLLQSCAAGPKHSQTADAPRDRSPAVTLSVGDPAPPLNISHWLKGEEIAAFERNRVYVVEFWATWCPPCIASIPHLSRLQKEYEDYGVTIIGISDEPLQTVVGFLARADREGVLWNDKIAYTLTTDPARSNHESYFRAAGLTGIPASFIVGKTGEIEWIGHPTSLDEPLRQIVRGEWNRETAREEIVRRREAQQKAAAQRRAMSDARETCDWGTLLTLIDENIEANDGHPRAMYQKFAALLADVKDIEAAYAYGEELVKKAWDDGDPFNAEILNAVAWFVVDNERVEVRDLDFALRVAERASELTRHESGHILDTLARVHYERGDLEEALTWQRRALEHGEDGPGLEEIRETLERYETEAAQHAAGPA